MRNAQIHVDYELAAFFQDHLGGSDIVDYGNDRVALKFNGKKLEFIEHEARGYVEVTLIFSESEKAIFMVPCVDVGSHTAQTTMIIDHMRR